MQKTTKTFVKKATATVLACSMALAFGSVVSSQAAAKKPTLNKTKLTLSENMSEKLKVKKNGFTIKSTKWSSDKKSVATVKKGVVTGENEGKATITAKVKAVAKGKKKAKTYKLKCKVTVTPEQGENWDGGWETASDPTITDDLKVTFDKAFEGIVGATYEPVALLATQVVAGTNYRFLARKTTATATPKSTYAFVDIWKDLDGSVGLLTTVGDGICSTTITANPKDGAAGAWTQASSPKIEDAILSKLTPVLDKAIKTPDGIEAKMTPVALVEQQVVNGLNVMLICESEFIGSDPGEIPSYSFVVLSTGPDFSDVKVSSVMHLSEYLEPTA